MKAWMVISRLLQGVVVMVGVSLLVFTMVRLVPGDPVLLLIGDQATEKEIEEARAQFGLDRPIWEQYLIYARNLLHGDFGRSVRYQQPALKVMLQALPATGQLAICSLIFSAVIGIPIGILSAVFKGSKIDNTMMVIMLVGQAMPVFWWGIMLIIFFAVILHILPTSGAGSLKHLVLPALTLSTYYTALIGRLTRSTMLEVLDQDYIRTVEAKGLNRRVVVLVHGLKNASIPIATVIGLQFAHMLGGAVITETVFAWPGVGMLAIKAVYNRDYPLVQAIVLLMSLVFVVVNLLVDLSYTFLDPRIREG